MEWAFWPFQESGQNLGGWGRRFVTSNTESPAWKKRLDLTDKAEICWDLSDEDEDDDDDDEEGGKKLL